MFYYLSRVAALGIPDYAVGKRMGQGKFMGCMYSPTFLPSAETIVGKTDAIVKMECEGQDTSGEKQNRATSELPFSA